MRARLRPAPGVHDIRDRHDYREEFKFSRVSRAKLPVFCELIDAIEQSDAHVAACVVDRTSGNDPFAQESMEWLAHARIAAMLLVGIINKRELACALLDEIRTPRGHAFDDTVRDMVNQRMRGTSLISASCVDSRCHDGVQLADLVAGAVAHQRGQGNGTASPVSHKGKVAARLAAAFGVDSFALDVRNERVNIATLGGKSPAQRRRPEAVPARVG